MRGVHQRFEFSGLQHYSYTGVILSICWHEGFGVVSLRRDDVGMFDLHAGKSAVSEFGKPMLSVDCRLNYRHDGLCLPARVNSFETLPDGIY
jgi:hypothetical protein